LEFYYKSDGSAGNRFGLGFYGNDFILNTFYSGDVSIGSTNDNGKFYVNGVTINENSSDQGGTALSNATITGVASNIVLSLPSTASARIYHFHCSGSFTNSSTSGSTIISVKMSQAVTTMTDQNNFSGVNSSSAGTDLTLIYNSPNTANTYLPWFSDVQIKNPASTANTFTVYLTSSSSSYTAYLGGDSSCTLMD
jgi:hypothetical protein